MSVIIQLKGGTAAKWQEVNPTLAEREMGIETDTHNYKIGDGFTSWNSLEYSSFPQNAEDGGNKVTTFDNPTDIQYPSAKLVYDQLEAKEGASVAALNNKVDKIIGKSLSDQNFTAQEKFKLSTILAGANPNVIETIKLNGVALSVTNKGVSFLAIQPSEKGADNGVATLDANGLVPLSQLPSYVSEIVELTSVTTEPILCSIGDKYYNSSTKFIYTASGTNTWGGTGVSPTTAFMYYNTVTLKSYRWSGTTMVEVVESVTLEEERSQGTATAPSSKLLDDELNKSTVYNVTTNNPALIGVGEYYSTAMNNLGSIKSAKASVPVTLRKDGLTIMYLTAEYEKTTLVITGAATADGSLYISLNGATPVPTALISGLSAIDTAAAIYINAAAFTGWTLTDPNGTATIIFTKDDVGYCKAPVITLGSTEINILTIKNPPTDTGNITISDGDLGSSVAIAISPTVDTTPELVAIKIAAGTYTGWSAVANGGSVIFTKTSIGAATPIACTNALGCEFVITRASTGTASTGTTYTTTRTKYGKDETWVIEQCINSAAWSTPASWRRLLTSTNLAVFSVPGIFESRKDARLRVPAEVRFVGLVLNYYTYTKEIQTIKFTNACVTTGTIKITVDGRVYTYNVTAGESIVSIVTALAITLDQDLTGKFVVTVVDTDTLMLTGLYSGIFPKSIFNSNGTGVLATPLQVQKGTPRSFIKEHYAYSDFSTNSVWVEDTYWVFEESLNPSILPFSGGTRNVTIEGDILTFKNEGFSLAIGKRLFYVTGTLDRVYTIPTGGATRGYLYLDLGQIDFTTVENINWDVADPFLLTEDSQPYGNYYLIATYYAYNYVREWTIVDTSLSNAIVPVQNRLFQNKGELFAIDVPVRAIEFDTKRNTIKIPSGYGVYGLESQTRYKTLEDKTCSIIPTNYNGSLVSSTMGILLFYTKTKEFKTLYHGLAQPSNTLIVATIRRSSISTSFVGDITVWGLENYKVDGIFVKSSNNVSIRNQEVEPWIQAAINPKYGYDFPYTLTKRFTLAQISDTHADITRIQNFVDYINNKQLVTTSSRTGLIDVAVINGDLVYNDFRDNFSNPAPTTNKYDYIEDVLLKSNVPVCITIGNHDVGNSAIVAYTGTQDEVFDKFFTEDILTQMALAAPEVTRVPDDKTSYYYKDFSTYGVRVITLNEYDYDYALTGADYTLVRGYKIYSRAQILWFIAALKGAKTAGYGVIICVHQCPSAPEDLVLDSNFSSSIMYTAPTTYMARNIIQEIVEAFRTGTDITLNGSLFTGAAAYLNDTVTYPLYKMDNITTDFSAGGEFLFYLCGHHHADFLGTFVTYPYQHVIGVTTAVCDGNGNRWDDLPRVVNTKSEDAFNIITVDRTVKAVFVVRVGASINSFFVDRKKAVFEYE